MKPRNKDLAMPDGLTEDGKRAWEAILGFLRKNSMLYTGGCKAFYSPTAWKERGEEYGHNSLLIVVHDGGDLAPIFNLDHECYDLHNTMHEWLESHGFWAEAQTCWYTAIYKS